MDAQIPTPTPHVVVVGASGVIGTSAVERFARAGYSVTAVSRRMPVVAADIEFAHVSVDLGDPAACSAVVSGLAPVTHLVYAATSEAPGLVQGWTDEARIAVNGAMFENIIDPIAAMQTLVHVSILQGTKAYGAHVHAVEIPARESEPRDPHPNFYWLHEDHAKKRAAEHGFDVTVFRPVVLFGHARGVSMNPVAAIGAYAAICRELGTPFAYPGSPTAVFEAIDADLLADAFVWAATAEAAQGETFNLTNGDLLVPRFAWERVAADLDLSSGTPQPQSLVEFFARDESQAAWAAIVEREGLHPGSLEEFLGESHHYFDMLFAYARPGTLIPTSASTIKVRRAGFDVYSDSAESITDQMRQMAELRLLPAF